MSIDEVVQGLTSPPEGAERSTAHPSRLFIGGLSHQVTVGEMQAKLEEYGPVAEAVIVTDRDTGDSRGFGFVTMADRRDAVKAIRALDGQDLWGRTLVVRQATERGR
ncbi:MAG: RNA-binding protein [Myxococcales bacterium FL481]|nr:MAG: RNA-binding protein [Myxococcales bacterium FL481]